MSQEQGFLAVLRLGFRPYRDARVNTHLCLTARALGADALFLTGEDTGLQESVARVVENFGGSFELVVKKRWRSVIQDFQGTKVHLSVYGDNLNTVMEDITTKFAGTGRLLVVVGGEKVPKEVYELCDFNVAVGNQPHSEIAALAVFLDRLQSGRELDREFGGNIHIDPYRDGKKQVTFKKDP